MLLFSIGTVAGLAGFSWGRRRSATVAGTLAQLLGGLFAIACATLLVIGVLIVFFGVKLEG